MNQRLLIGLALCLLVNCVHSDSSPDAVPSIDTFSVNPFYSGGLKLVLDRDQYVAGDPLHANISLQNTENFPITDAYIIVEIVEGKEHIFPSSISDDNNLFYETVIGGVNLAPGATKTVPFSYNLP
jgi:hypothetical protein